MTVRADEPVIEMLAPDASAFGWGDGNGLVTDDDWLGGEEFTDDAPKRPRWTAVVAVLAAAGLLIGAVVAAAPWDESAAPTPTTVPSTTVRPTPTTASEPTPIDVDIEGGALRYGFSPEVAGLALEYSSPMEGNGRNDWGQVWAEEGATRTTGRWISITLGDDQPEQLLEATESEKFLLPDGRVATRGRSRDDVASIGVAVGDPAIGEQQLLVEAYGFTDTELTAIVASIDLDRGGPASSDDRPMFSEPTLVDGLLPVFEGPVEANPIDDALFDGLQGVAGYSFVAEAGPDGNVAAVVATSRLTDQQGDVRRFAADPVGSPNSPVTFPEGFDGTDVFVGTRRVGTDRVVIMSWVTAEQLRVTVLLPLPLDEALALVDDVEIIGGSVADGGAWALNAGLSGVELESLTVLPDAEPTGHGFVWASETAFRTSGAWVSLTALEPDTALMRPDAWLAAAGDRIVQVSIDDDGVLTVRTAEPIEGFDVQITSFGRPLDVVLGAMSNVTVQRGLPTLTPAGDVALIREAEPTMIFLGGGATDDDLVRTVFTGRVFSIATYRRRGDALGTRPLVTITGGRVDAALCRDLDCDAVRELSVQRAALQLVDGGEYATIETTMASLWNDLSGITARIGSVEAQRRAEAAGWADPAWFGEESVVALGRMQDDQPWSVTVYRSGWTLIDDGRNGWESGALLGDLGRTFTPIASPTETFVLVADLDPDAVTVEVIQDDLARRFPLDAATIADTSVAFGAVVIEQPGPFRIRTLDGTGRVVTERSFGGS
jgi:hypothetical protein